MLTDNQACKIIHEYGGQVYLDGLPQFDLNI
jgi:glycine cleavage system protein P-like pyridoxal-binding family